MRRLNPSTAVCLALVLALGAAGPAGTFAQRAAPITFQGGLGLAATWFDAEAPNVEGGVGVHLDFGARLYRVLALRLEVGADYLGPLCFEQGTACERARSRRNDTFMLSGAAALGAFTRPLRLGSTRDGLYLAVGLYAGHQWVEAGVGRGACLNCRADVDVRGGLFLEPALEVSLFPGFGFGVAYRAYRPRADLEGRLTARFFSTNTK